MSKHILAVTSIAVILVLVGFLITNQQANQAHSDSKLTITEDYKTETNSQASTKKQNSLNKAIKSNVEHSNVVANSVEKLNLEEGEFNTKTQDKCVSYEDYISSPEVEKVKAWYDSWGFPSYLIGLSGDLFQQEHLYFNIENDNLLDLAQQGDSAAHYAMGMNYIWQGMTGQNLSPYLSSDPSGVDESLFVQVPNKDLLEKGRKHLLEAAALGNIHAYTELAMSYAYELSVRRQSMSVSETTEYEKLIALYGNLPSKIIPELGEEYFNSSYINSAERQQEIERLWDDELARVEQYRSEKGDAEIVIAPQTDFFETPNICN
jgi:TPR repeat protein